MSLTLRRVVDGVRDRAARVAEWAVGHRTLLIHYRELPSHSGSTPESGKPVVRKVSREEFATLDWRGNPWVFPEAHAFDGGGMQCAYCAMSGEGVLLGFAWLERGVADLRFFETHMPLPSDVGYLSRVWIDDRTRGQGIGGHLVAAMEASASHLSLRGLVAGCVPQNHRMLALFRRRGWQLIGRIDRVHALGVHAFRTAPNGTHSTLTVGGQMLLAELVARHVTHGSHSIE